MARRLETILDGLAFGEGPRWRDGELYFSDMHAHEVVAVTPAGRRRTVASFDEPVSGLGWLPDGRILVVSMADRRVLRQEGDGFVLHGDLAAIATGLANDMVVTADGRAFVGNFGFSLHPPGEPKPARLARIDPDGSVHAAADDMMFPNGMVITPDGKTLIVGESWGRRLTAFDLAADGTLTNRRLWAAFPENALPDGICLDAEGAIWAASPSTSEVLRIAEGGAVLDRLATEQLAIACMLGGANRRTLFVLTAASTDPDVCKASRTARVQAVTVDVPGAGLP
jgi:sugar lactone lactonase YvrE